MTSWRCRSVRRPSAIRWCDRSLHERLRSAAVASRSVTCNGPRLQGPSDRQGGGSAEGSDVGRRVLRRRTLPQAGVDSARPRRDRRRSSIAYRPDSPLLAVGHYTAGTDSIRLRPDIGALSSRHLEGYLRHEATAPEERSRPSPATSSAPGTSWTPRTSRSAVSHLRLPRCFAARTSPRTPRMSMVVTSSSSSTPTRSTYQETRRSKRSTSVTPGIPVGCAQKPVRGS